MTLSDRAHLEMVLDCMFRGASGILRTQDADAAMCTTVVAFNAQGRIVYPVMPLHDESRASLDYCRAYMTREMDAVAAYGLAREAEGSRLVVYAELANGLAAARAWALTRGLDGRYLEFDPVENGPPITPGESAAWGGLLRPEKTH